MNKGSAVLRQGSLFPAEVWINTIGFDPASSDLPLSRVADSPGAGDALLMKF